MPSQWRISPPQTSTNHENHEHPFSTTSLSLFFHAKHCLGFPLCKEQQSIPIQANGTLCSSLRSQVAVSTTVQGKVDAELNQYCCPFVLKIVLGDWTPHWSHNDSMSKQYAIILLRWEYQFNKNKNYSVTSSQSACKLTFIPSLLIISKWAFFCIHKLCDLEMSGLIFCCLKPVDIGLSYFHKAERTCSYQEY